MEKTTTTYTPQFTELSSNESVEFDAAILAYPLEVDLEIDLSNVGYISSACLGVLITTNEKRTGKTTLINLQDKVLKVIDHLGLQETLTVPQLIKQR